MTDLRELYSVVGFGVACSCTFGSERMGGAVAEADLMLKSAASALRIVSVLCTSEDLRGFGFLLC